eukprot:6462146-Amphidinium_carterae.4
MTASFLELSAINYCHNSARLAAANVYRHDRLRWRCFQRQDLQEALNDLIVNLLNATYLKFRTQDTTLLLNHDSDYM